MYVTTACHLTRLRWGRWRCVSSPWFSLGRRQSAKNDLLQSLFSCECVKPAGNTRDWARRPLNNCWRSDGRVTSFVNLSITSGFPLIRATRLRLFSASSNRFLRTNQRADSEYHLTNERADTLVPPVQSDSKEFCRHLFWQSLLTSCRQRTGSVGHRQPPATSSSLWANRQALLRSSDQRWRRRRWACPPVSSLWSGSTPPLKTGKWKKKGQPLTDRQKERCVDSKTGGYGDKYSERRHWWWFLKPPSHWEIWRCNKLCM